MEELFQDSDDEPKVVSLINPNIQVGYLPLYELRRWKGMLNEYSDEEISEFMKTYDDEDLDAVFIMGIRLKTIWNRYLAKAEKRVHPLELIDPRYYDKDADGKLKRFLLKNSLNAATCQQRSISLTCARRLENRQVKIKKITSTFGELLQRNAMISGELEKRGKKATPDNKFSCTSTDHGKNPTPYYTLQDLTNAEMETYISAYGREPFARLIERGNYNRVAWEARLKAIEAAALPSKPETCEYVKSVFADYDNQECCFDLPDDFCPFSSPMITQEPIRDPIVNIDPNPEWLIDSYDNVDTDIDNIDDITAALNRTSVGDAIHAENQAKFAEFVPEQVIVDYKESAVSDKTVLTVSTSTIEVDKCVVDYDYRYKTQTDPRLGEFMPCFMRQPDYLKATMHGYLEHMDHSTDVGDSFRVTLSFAPYVKKTPGIDAAYFYYYPLNYPRGIAVLDAYVKFSSVVNILEEGEGSFYACRRIFSPGWSSAFRRAFKAWTVSIGAFVDCTDINTLFDANRRRRTSIVVSRSIKRMPSLDALLLEFCAKHYSLHVDNRIIVNVAQFEFLDGDYSHQGLSLALGYLDYADTVDGDKLVSFFAAKATPNLLYFLERTVELDKNVRFYCYGRVTGCNYYVFRIEIPKTKDDELLSARIVPSRYYAFGLCTAEAENRVTTRDVRKWPEKTKHGRKKL